MISKLFSACTHSKTIIKPLFPLKTNSVFKSTPKYLVNNRRQLTVTNQAPSDVFVLDFDGVLVDSEPEISNSGLEFAKQFWPRIFQKFDQSKLQQISDKLTELRPVLINGYEIVVMARMLAEDEDCVEDVLARWPEQLEQQFESWGVDGDEVKKQFEDYRVGLQNDDSGDWLKLNSVYPGVKEGLVYCEFPFYIVSSKSAKRVANLMQNLLGMKGIDADSPRLFADLLPPDTEKPKTLKQINDRPVCKDSGARLHFVDDRLDTLISIKQDPQLQNWRLYLAEWGYLSKKDKQIVQQGLPEGIVPLNLKNFLELLKWGILMGVDDGCEPTAEEVEEGVTAGLQRKT